MSFTTTSHHLFYYKIDSIVLDLIEAEFDRNYPAALRMRNRYKCTPLLICAYTMVFRHLFDSDIIICSKIWSGYHGAGGNYIKNSSIYLEAQYWKLFFC